ncbi:CHAT domain-containing protein [Dactylosporangium sp. NPDC049525]|uniref:CHAT domain-containing protein n=1 Tax=Dactylosporangium sp. NPDC049525 TaxID=3154730 RepID=UPI00341841B3
MDVAAVRVLISYAHGDVVHEEQVRRLWTLLRAEGVDAVLDVVAEGERQFWPQWMAEQIRVARFVLVVASAGYRVRGEDTGDRSVGRGVRWEARQLQEMLYADFQAGTRKIVPVVLPGEDAADLPDWVLPTGSTTYRVEAFTSEGVDGLLRLLTGQPLDVEPPLGQVRPRPPRPFAIPDVRAEGLRTLLEIGATVEDGQLTAVVSLAGTVLGTRSVRLPADVVGVWSGLRVGGAVAGERLLQVGRLLAAAVFDEAGHRLVADLVARLRPGSWVDVVVTGDGAALEVPFELLRLVDSTGEDLGPLALIGGVSVRRRLPGSSPVPPAALAGPLKILAAVAAPLETLTGNVPLDVEAEMQAVMDAVTPHAGQARILEVASLAQIRDALRRDTFHVLHLSAHGSPEMIELEDEDGRPQQVTTRDLIGVIRDAGTPVPLIMLSSCSGAGGRAGAMAASLVRAGADRVIAMQAAVNDTYATALAAALYQELTHRPDAPVSAALALARRTVAQSTRDGDWPGQFAVATLLTAGDDPPMIDPVAVVEPLRVAPAAPSGTSVRELSLGQLIGRRASLRAATAVLRRTDAARGEHGTIAGVQVLGIGGIGKTALAGRLIARRRGDGVVVAVHEGRWNPTALMTAVADAVAAVPGLAQAAGALVDVGVSDAVKVDLVGRLLGGASLLLVFDDFEQNLTPGGGAFLDPVFETVFTGWCEAAETGSILVTCRYPLPDDDRYLVRVPVPPLSPAELRRLLLRHPALADLPADERRLLYRVIGGHPRLVEYVDALVRGKPTRFRAVQAKLKTLAAAQGIDLRRPRPVEAAIDTALLLGSADILLAELLELLTAEERAVLNQVSVCRAPMTVDDLHAALRDAPGLPSGFSAEDLRRVVERLTDLTLLSQVSGGAELQMHPWTAEILQRQVAAADTVDLHERALRMRLARFEQRRAGYDDLLDLTRHQAALHQYDDITGIARSIDRILPGAMAAAAYLAEIRPLLPRTEPAWCNVAKAEYDAVTTTGNLVAARNILTDTYDAVTERLTADPDSPMTAAQLNVVLVDLGDLAANTGDLRTAQSHYQAAVENAGRWSAQDTDNTWWQNRDALLNSRLGEVAQAAGNLTTATEHYQAAVAIRERLVAADPTNSRWQRDLSVDGNKLGDVARAAGDLTAATERYRAGLVIAERLAAADPTDSQWQRDLSISRNKLGDVARLAGDLTAATEHYRAGLVIAERLAAADHTNSQWQRDLSISWERLGDVAQAAGDLTAAAEHHQAALVIAERLAAADPTNSRWQRDLSISRNKLGDVAQAAGDLTAAAEHYQADLAIAERLAAADPTNSGWQRDLSVSRNKLGDVAQAAGDLTTATEHYQAALAIRERLVAADPTNIEWQRDLAFSRERLSEVTRTEGETPTGAPGDGGEA